jgi:ribosomal protein S27E
MWCPRCQRTTTTRPDPSADVGCCAQCGGPLTNNPTGGDAVRRAQEILNRWQSSSILEQIQSAERIPPFDWAAARPRNAVASKKPVKQPVSPSPRSTPSDDGSMTSMMHLPSETAPSGKPISSPVVQSVATESAAVPADEDPPASHATDTISERVVNDVNDAGETQEKSGDEESSARLQRRVPLHRRVRPVNPAPASFSGIPTVKRKLRIDQPTNGIQNDAESVKKNDSVQGPGTSGETASPPPAFEQTESPASPATALSNSESARPRRRVRIDSPQSVQELSETDHRRSRGSGQAKRRYIDEPHGASPPGPHFQVTSPRSSNLTAMTGQFLAYIGVLGLTIGTAIVIYGHFGGGAEYTPTGWLVTTVAQMLLFLGIINLVSGGIEQNNDEVSRRINTLGEQLLRIELVTEEALRGPKISPRRYMDSEAEETHVVRESADVHRG